MLHEPFVHAFNMKFMYCLLPGGNSAEFPNLEAEMKRLGVALARRDLEGSGVVYRIPYSDRKKLHTDNYGFYFGTATSGHALICRDEDPYAHLPSLDDYQLVC